MKFINKRNLRKGIILLFAAIFLAYIIFSSKSYSKSEITYKKEIISKGDTIWSIAKDQKNENDYYKNKDIRYIVYDIQQLNNISNSNLTNGQEILIPFFE